MSSAEDFDMLERGALMERATRLTKYTDPFRFSDVQPFKDLMLEVLQHKASDIFIQPDFPVCARIQGRLLAITHRVVDGDEVKNILKIAAGRDTAVTDIVSGIAVNGRYELFDPTLRDARGAKVRYGYRVNASPIHAAGGTSCQIVMRPIPTEPPRFDQVGLSESLVLSAIPENGIVYIAGATGSGKTTTIAAIIRYILENDTVIRGNFLTHEEPIEFTFELIQSKQTVVVQSQIPTHFKTFYEANREAMRRKPGGVLVGELRDEETIRAAIELSLTGHPVYGTAHASNVASIARRIISRFPEDERQTAIFDIVETARFMMAQKLVVGVNGKLLAAREYLVFDDEVRETLIELDQMGKVTSCLKMLIKEKGHSFEQEGKRLFEMDLINKNTMRALAAS